MLFRGPEVWSHPIYNFLKLQPEFHYQSVKGDTVSGAQKPAVLETGVSIQVPLFVEEGEVVKVDTRSSEYLGRANDSWWNKE